MLVKFIARGTGSAQAAADYLTRELDSQGAVRDDVAVLRGDPDQVAAVADALAFEHTYTSGVIAWAPEDQPSAAQIDQVLDEFEKTAWTGLAPDRYAWAAVQHREAAGSVHVHVLAARCDLETGKSLNIAPPGWEPTFGALRDWQNHTHGWSRPDDPARARNVVPPGPSSPVHLRDGQQGITDYVTQGIEAGIISDRATMVSALQRAGLEVPRQGKDYLTVAEPGTTHKWRLKGAIFGRDFQRDERLDRADRRSRAAGERLRGAARATSRRLAGAAAAARTAGRDLLTTQYAHITADYKALAKVLIGG